MAMTPSAWDETLNGRANKAEKLIDSTLTSTLSEGATVRALCAVAMAVLALRDAVKNKA